MLYKVVKCSTRQMALNADQNNIIYLNINSNHTTTIYKNYIITQNEKVPFGCVALSAQQRKDINILVSTKRTPSYINIL